jgi:outer membrane immunogenic protein
MCASTASAAEPTWSGLYLGAGVGYSAFVANTTPFDATPPFAQQNVNHDVGGDGWLGTVIVGFDHRISPGVVIGIFADYDWTDAEGEWKDLAAGADVSGTYRQDSAWAIGGRLGVLSNAGTLLYLSGGYTEAKFDQLDFFFFAGGPGPVRIIPSTTFDGWFVGAGMETLLWQNLSLRLEYRYSDFGEERVARFNPATGGNRNLNDIDITTHSGRVVLSYRFDWARTEAPLK